MNGNRPISDNDVLRTLGDSVSGMPTAQPPPVEMIKARGRAHQRRKLIPGLAVAVAAGAALAVTALVPASHQPSNQASHPAPAQLAAWTVVKHADGKIYLTLRQFRDPAGLQARLRADGIPASVTPSGQPNPACHAYPLKGSQESQRALISGAVALPATRPVVAIINPSVLPGGAGIQMLVTLTRHDIVSGGAVGLVSASPQCTGS
jgi:hypothetical protein